MKNRTEDLRELIADIRYRNDYCGKELKEFSGLYLYLQNIYLREADEILGACKEKGMAFVVDRELPDCPIWPILDLSQTAIPSYKLAQKDMISDDWKPTEEIDIEENTD